MRVSSVELSKFLVSIGLCVGDKIRNQIDVPGWIFEDQEYIKGCIRGLIDTDGNIARKNYHVKTLAMQISFRNEWSHCYGLPEEYYWNWDLRHRE